MSNRTEMVPLGTQISPEHRDKLDHLKKGGFQINISIQNGIDLFYEQMVKARVIEPIAVQREMKRVA